jgi:hypothetical protein
MVVDQRNREKEVVLARPVRKRMGGGEKGGTRYGGWPF